MGCSFYGLNWGNIITLIGILVNAALAVWIVNSLQSNQKNKRFLKDHLIQEIKDLRCEYRKFLSELYSGHLKPKQILPWFKLMNIKIQDTMDIVNQKYKVEKGFLKCYQMELRELVTELKEFNANFKNNDSLRLNENSLKEIIKFQQDYNSRFNSLIIQINDKK